MTSQSTDDLVRDLLALHTTRCDDDCPLCLSARAIQELQRDALRWDFFRRTMLNSEARRYSFMRYFDLEPKIAEDLRDPDKAIDEAMQHDLVKRLEDACCCEPDQGFEPCGACKDLGMIERLQRDLQECVELLDRFSQAVRQGWHIAFDSPMATDARALLARLKERKP